MTVGGLQDGTAETLLVDGLAVELVDGNAQATAANGYSVGVVGLHEHIEAIEVHYDPAKVSYGTLVEAFWQQYDPTDAGGSFYDRMGRVECWNSVMDENRYMVRKWNEFIAA